MESKRQHSVVSFLIIQTAFIGDVILATPVLEKIHQYFPDASIDFLVRKGNESLLDNHPFLRRVLVWDKRRQKYPHLWQLLRDIRSQQYTYVVNLQRFTASGLLTAFSGAPHRIGFDKNPLWWRFTHHVPHHIASTGAADLLNIEKGFRQMTEASGAQQYVHEVDRNLSLIAHLTDNQRLRPRLYPDEKVFDRLSIVDDYYCVAPTSVWFTKQWPSGKWVELLNAFDESHKDKTIYLLGAPADRAACDQIMQASKNKQIINLAGQLNLLESAALMSRASMNFVNDSAPLHLASAGNAPVVAMFCSTVPAFGFTPLSDRSYVMETELELDCRPCGLHGYKACPRGHFKCSEISVQRIMNAISKTI